MSLLCTGRSILALFCIALLVRQTSSSASAVASTKPTGEAALRKLQYYDQQYYDLETCEDLIVQVTSLSTVCDSPQTFYYGSGVNRNSKSCNYGDKATTTVYFDVMEDLTDTNIYVVISVYAGYGNEVLTSTSPKNLKKYVGSSCTTAGSYYFTYTSTVGSSSSYSSSSGGSFIPFVQLAFSSETNGDYNLGAANIPCQWDDREFGEWTEVTANNSQWTSQDFLSEYGILLATVGACFLFVAILAKVTQVRRRRVKELRRKSVHIDNSLLPVSQAPAV